MPSVLKSLLFQGYNFVSSNSSLFSATLQTDLFAFKSSVPSFLSKLGYPIQYSHDVIFAGSDGDAVC